MRRQKLIPVILFLIGLGLLIYGAGYCQRSVLAQDEKSSTVRPETQLIREVTVGGLARTDSGTLILTYSEEGPSLCPT
jgi:hypothetical protein